jgi:hypothetical protein
MSMWQRQEIQEMLRQVNKASVGCRSDVAGGAQWRGDFTIQERPMLRLISGQLNVIFQRFRSRKAELRSTPGHDTNQRPRHFSPFSSSQQQAVHCALLRIRSM